MMRRNKGYHYKPYKPARGGYGRSRGPQIRWDRVLPIGGGILFILILVIVFNFSRIQCAFKGYSFSQQSDIVALTSDKIDLILAQDKMDHISTWIDESNRVSYYDKFEKYYSMHSSMQTKDVVTKVTSIFDNYVPKLKTMGYSTSQVWKVLKTASTDDLSYLIEHQYSYDTIAPYMAVKGFAFQDMADYIKVYAKKQNYNYAVLITTYPFIISSNSTTKHYTIKNPSSYVALVKKGFYLPTTYEPKDLVTPGKSDIPVSKDCEHPKLRKQALKALDEMYVAAKKQGYYLMINSAYRSYSEQKATYSSYEHKYGGLYAAQHVAIPGASEHQTGLGVDLTSQSVEDGTRLVFGDTAEYKWVCQNAYRFGYILRFEDGTSKITGITQEPWHFRYVGTAAAKIIHEKGWTLEEYCLYEGVLPTLAE